MARCRLLHRSAAVAAIIGAALVPIPDQARNHHRLPHRKMWRSTLVRTARKLRARTLAGNVGVMEAVGAKRVVGATKQKTIPIPPSTVATGATPITIPSPKRNLIPRKRPVDDSGGTTVAMITMIGTTLENQRQPKSVASLLATTDVTTVVVMMVIALDALAPTALTALVGSLRRPLISKNNSDNLNSTKRAWRVAAWPDPTGQPAPPHPTRPSSSPPASTRMAVANLSAEKMPSPTFLRT